MKKQLNLLSEKKIFILPILIVVMFSASFTHSIKNINTIPTMEEFIKEYKEKYPTKTTGEYRQKYLEKYSNFLEKKNGIYKIQTIKTNIKVFDDGKKNIKNTNNLLNQDGKKYTDNTQELDPDGKIKPVFIKSIEEKKMAIEYLKSTKKIELLLKKFENFNIRYNKIESKFKDKFFAKYKNIDEATDIFNSVVTSASFLGKNYQEALLAYRKHGLKAESTIKKLIIETNMEAIKIAYKIINIIKKL